ncbi:hypothetical protein [Desulfosporosinus orientis]|uniref:hypothetical protein n=1 Tax=Desulfosporosinus orientis TaxID=1563 RepID=UPI00030752E5
MPDLQYFDYGEKEIQWLKARDPILGAAIDEIGHINRPVIPDMFMALVNAIVGQQISTKAQVTIWNRMLEKFSSIITVKLHLSFLINTNAVIRLMQR